MQKFVITVAHSAMWEAEVSRSCSILRKLPLTCRYGATMGENVASVSMLNQRFDTCDNSDTLQLVCERAAKTEDSEEARTQGR